MAIGKNGELYIWGSDPTTQVHETTPDKFDSIVKVEGIPGMKAIACGSWHSLAIDSTGQVWAWGRNDFGMLGTGDSVGYSLPQKVPNFKNIQAVGGGCFQSLAIDVDGNFFTFGSNACGQQGQGNHEFLYAPKPLVLEAKAAEKKGNPLEWINSNWILLLLLASLVLNIFLFLTRSKTQS